MLGSLGSQCSHSPVRRRCSTHLCFRGASFISDEQQVTLTVHYNLLLKAPACRKDTQVTNSDASGGRRSDLQGGGADHRLIRLIECEMMNATQEGGDWTGK